MAIHCIGGYYLGLQSGSLLDIQGPATVALAFPNCCFQIAACAVPGEASTIAHSGTIVHDGFEGIAELHTHHDTPLSRVSMVSFKQH